MAVRLRKGFEAINPNWKPITRKAFNKSLETLEMRPNQLAVYNDHSDDRFLIVRQPPGAGKSATVKFVLAPPMLDNLDLKIIITVPQNMIGSSFGNDVLRYPDGTEIKWQIDPTKDLTYGNYLSKINEIKSFIRKNKFPAGLHERIMLCSHAGLVRACEEMRRVSWDNIILVIDEAQHAQGAAKDEIAMNGLGRVVKSVIRSKSKTSRLWFTTATFFRGDGVDILSPEDMAKFNTYFLPLDKHFATLKFIKSYAYDFVPYKGELPRTEIEFLLEKHRDKKILFYIPSVGRLFAGRNKEETVKKMRDIILGVKKDAKIVDLVCEGGRDARKKHLMDNKYDSDIDVVLSVDLFNEGVDWVEAEVVIDLAPSNSLRVANQRFGRLLRDHWRKKHIHYYCLFPCYVDFQNKEDCRKQLSGNFATLSASFMLEESILPVKLPVDKPKKKKKGEGKQRTEKINYFQEVVPDEAERHGIRLTVFEELLRLTSNDEITSPSEYRAKIIEVLESNLIQSNINEIAIEIEAELTRRVVPNFGVDMKWIVDKGFDKIRWKKITDYICHFVSGYCGKKVLNEFRKYFEGQQKTPEEWVKIAGELAIANEEGKLGEYEG